MERAEAVVIGGGVMGTSIAFNLARRRFGRVVLLEKGAICSGTSGKSSAIVRTHYTTPPTARMALLARRIFERFREEVGGESGFVRTGMLVVAAPEQRGAVERTIAMNREIGSSREVRGLHYCVGFSGHGFKLAPVAGLLMAGQIVDGRASTLDIAPYRLERFGEGQALEIGYPRAGVVA